MRYGWSLDRQLWGDTIPILSSSRWKRRQLDPLYADEIPARPGVYVICSPATPQSGTGLFGRLYNALYVGRSKDLRDRFKTHCRYPKPQLRKAIDCFPDQVDFWCLPVALDEYRHSEAILIKCLGPAVNLVEGTITARIGSEGPA